MICPKCGNNISDGVDYCIRCGNIISTTDGGVVTYNDTPNVNSTSNTIESNTDISNLGLLSATSSSSFNILEDECVRDELVQSYIGYKYIDFANVGFSWCYFIFGDLYLFYRKMFSYFFKVFILRILIVCSIIFAPSALEKLNVIVDDKYHESFVSRLQTVITNTSI